MSASDYMRAMDVVAFREAAKHFQVWILVRASKAAARDYIGRKGYVPKRLDCKAKAADFNVKLPGMAREKTTAGLVVNPRIPGMERAFEDGERAKEFWDKFKVLCYIPIAGKPTVYFPDGKFYSVQMNPAHEHYGCVIFSHYSNTANASYIHSDYDLYGIVPADDPAPNVRRKENRLDVDHTCSRFFFDVQHFLNHRMGVPMILHGEQDTYQNGMDEDIDVFSPDGSEPIEAYGADAIRRLYETTFKGRQLYGGDEMPKPFFGEWQVLAPTRTN